MNELFRQLPSVDEVLTRLEHVQARFPRKLIVEEARRVLAVMRDELRTGRNASGSVEERVMASLEGLEQPSLRHVINATGVVLHTNLGRAPLPQFVPLAGYSNLEYDIDAGRRGKRDIHVSSLLERLIGAPGIAVNNNAAAVYLVLNELAAGFEVIVSRGELIEIGDGFRIPDIMQRSGAILREVGTTNRTRIEDYRAAVNDRTRLLLRVHPSNFRMQGFTSKPELRELAALGKELQIPVYEDLGSGCVVDLRRIGFDEPLVAQSLEAGVSVVTFSGDKLLGGPQAGIIGGDGGLVARIRRNPMFRALRLDKLIYQALETTLRNLLLEHWNDIPALRMILQTADEIRERAMRLIPGAQLVPGQSVIGGGSTPEQSVPTWLIAIECADVVEAERRCRAADPPVIARIEDDRLLFDLRTVLPEEEPALARTIVQARS
jgi:L-seryl-tRNA(Ser) seleniumtransferase